ncbi:MerR family transcriptional regulator [Chromobacterium violaceum]|uniref:Probable transcriptional regulator, MerR family n=1 Tax=Chromobacterium violaceum (strain ATCC 12472 / DSM 30191 / JCM 1249 / CCUG 213 / NBRC 12614 / NCIMB 9131 / NCTC 9757 / MK) TaxID=243365 RepID=Q7NX50_CHRVO|nr:MerR family DNA-binding transcriptional regulator [Chromobacterium violaceum]AAQ59453.1 probable transcriptional regulator, MerR family [Chromobacterium violaceum ATCC 12472]ATP28387.1 MerR family transcriptional regulator [Chromobacterium violaceum]ATP32296.1 MerR family transcriptional regulator [Chromobacterium violaceum]KJH67051.1 MerR family transcriptional regulator [Chromobacterium violaceum]KMN51179.1 MerR family transcriptional regulator [Chromobacterium violaceum]
MSQAELFTISDLAREFDVTLRTIRFYEEQGLIEPQRDGRQRLFTRRDRGRLKLILRGKRIGLSLAEIREIIDMYQLARDEASQSQKLLDLLLARRRQLEAQRRDIDAVLDEIATLENHCRDVIDSQSSVA